MNTIVQQTEDQQTEQVTNINVLEFVLPTFFHYVTDDSGNLKLPSHSLMPLTIEAYNDKNNKVKIAANQFTGQLLFTDPLTQNLQLIYISGSNIEHELNFPKWPSAQAEDVHVQYPILAYKSQLATNNEICIVNLVKNAP